MGFSGKSRSVMGRLESEVVWKFPSGEMAFGLRLHLGRRLAERIAIGRVLVDALAQVVEQHAEFAGVFGVDHQQMHARPIQVGPGRGSANRDVNAAHLESGEELGQPVFEGRRHLRGIGFQKQPRQLAIDRRRDRALFPQHDGIAVAAFGQGRGRGPPLGIAENQDADGHRCFEIRLADHLAQRVAELLEPHHGFASGARARVGEHFERPRGELHPMVVRRQQAGEETENEEPPHASSLSRGGWAGVAGRLFARIEAHPVALSSNG